MSRTMWGSCHFQCRWHFQVLIQPLSILWTEHELWRGPGGLPQDPFGTKTVVPASYQGGRPDPHS